MYSDNKDLTNTYSLVELESGKKVGISAIKISKVPSYDSSVCQEKYQALINKMNGYLKSVHDFMNIDYCIELLFVSAEDSNGVAKIEVYIIFRALSYTDIEIYLGLQQLVNITTTLLKGENYGFTVLSRNNYEIENIINSLPDTRVWSLVKDECQVPSYTPVTSFYYHSVVMPSGNMGMKDVFAALANYPGSAVSISLIPTKPSYTEYDSIERVTYLLNQISNGFYDESYGTIKDNLAETPYNYYQYYYNNMDNLYVATVSVFGDQIKLKPVETQLIQTMMGDGKSITSFGVDSFHVSPDITYANSFHGFPWIIYDRLQEMSNSQSFWLSDESPKSLQRMRFFYTTDEISNLFYIPFAVDRNISGIKVKNDSHVEAYFDKGILNNDNNIPLGFFDGSEDMELGIPLKDLTKHMFISGVPGCGKTTFAQSLLYNLYQRNIPFLIIEPAKNEYRALVDLVPELQIFTPGRSDISPFPINPFIPPKNVTLQAYKASLITAFEVAFDMEGPLRSLFMETIDNCYLEYGWRDSYTVDDGAEIFGLVEFIKEFREAMRRKAYSQEVRNNIETAGVVRLMNLINTNYTIFDVHNSVPIEDILKKPSLIELNAIENSSQKSLIISLILTNIFAYSQCNISPENYDTLNNVILLEEAHVLLANNGSRNESGNAGNVAVDLINRILSEKRSSGFSLIVTDQSPQKVTPDVIRNTGTKIAFRTVDGEDRRIISEAINLAEKDFGNLALLQPGNAFIFSEKLDRTVRIRTKDFRNMYSFRDTISDNEVVTKNRYWALHKSLSCPFGECEKNKYCENGCDYQVRAEARYVVNYICKKNNCDESFGPKDFVRLVSTLNSLIESQISRKFEGRQRDQVKRCIKIELLRKLFMDTNLPLDKKQRMALLNNPKY